MAVLSSDAQFYKRLLAMDDNEAKQVLDRYRKDKPSEDLFDSVQIPALSLAKQDRHRNEIGEATERFMRRSDQGISGSDQRPKPRAG
jgi:hypothetical protein